LLPAVKYLIGLNRFWFMVVSQRCSSLR